MIRESGTEKKKMKTKGDSRKQDNSEDVKFSVEDNIRRRPGSLPASVDNCVSSGTDNTTAVHSSCATPQIEKNPSKLLNRQDSLDKLLLQPISPPVTELWVVVEAFWATQPYWENLMTSQFVPPIVKAATESSVFYKQLYHSLVLCAWRGALKWAWIIMHTLKVLIICLKDQKGCPNNTREVLPIPANPREDSSQPNF